MLESKCGVQTSHLSKHRKQKYEISSLAPKTWGINGSHPNSSQWCKIKPNLAKLVLELQFKVAPMHLGPISCIIEEGQEVSKASLVHFRASRMHKSSILAVFIHWSWSNFDPLAVHALCRLVGVSLSLSQNSGKELSNESSCSCSCSCSCSSIGQPLIPQIEPQSQAYHLPDKFQCRRVNFDDPYLSIQGSFCNEAKSTWKTFELLLNELSRSKFGGHLIKESQLQRQVVQAATQIQHRAEKFEFIWKLCLIKKMRYLKPV